jgi:hypothetical protein
MFAQCQHTHERKDLGREKVSERGLINFFPIPYWKVGKRLLSLNVQKIIIELNTVGGEKVG